MSTNPTTDHPIDPTGPLTIGQIPDADLDRLVAATAEPTWRDYAEQLTEEQVAKLERFEGMIRAGQPQEIRWMYEQAEYMAALNVIDAQYADVPLPEGANSDEESWSRNCSTGEWTRHVEWQVFDTGIADMDVHIDGAQNLDGSFTRDISLYAEDAKLDAKQARRLAAALLNAADAMDTDAESPSSPLASLLGAVDPATLKAKDRAVLLDFLKRAFDAAGVR